jgi:hypothetical protein
MKSWKRYRERKRTRSIRFTKLILKRRLEVFCFSPLEADSEEKTEE